MRPIAPMDGATADREGMKTTEGPLPFVSVVIPCRDEVQYIRGCLDSILANDYPKDRYEVLVVDGMSRDGTRAIAEDYGRRYPFVRVIDNPKGTTPAALNIGVRGAKGELIVRMDAHAGVEEGYISKCIAALKKYGADNVGGIMKTLPREDTLTARAVATVLSSRFGVGNSYFRIHTRSPKWVDTVFGGCYRKEVFERTGLFNENLLRGQDMEFNLRLKRAGGKTLLDPGIVSFYYPRCEFGVFVKNNYHNGLWAILPFLYSPIRPVSWRHLAPLAFVSALIASAGPALAGWLGWAPFLALAGAYAAASLGASIHAAAAAKELRQALILPIVFLGLHLSYGLGSLAGAGRLAFSFLRRKGL